MSAARGFTFDWGAGPGRATMVRDPPPSFLAQLVKTVRIREAAKTVLEAEAQHQDCAVFKPAINAVATFEYLKGTDVEPIQIVPNIVFCVTSLVRELLKTTMTSRQISSKMLCRSSLCGL